MIINNSMIIIIIYFGKSLSKSDKALIKETLSDSRGWTKKGFVFKYTNNAKKANIKMYKISSQMIKQRYGKKFSDLSLSIRIKNQPNKGRIYLNSQRWKNGGNDFNGKQYKQYIINHEIGHLFGFNHKIPNGEKKCPVMYQQTLGTVSLNRYPCSPNSWV